MAWRSSGTTNDEMVDNLKRFGVISSPAIEQGFRNVDRRFFVPLNRRDVAHSDQPLKEGNVHISAPHIYGSALEALELQANSSHSFLNVGCGTGYLSCIVADVLGPKSTHYGIEIFDDVVQHCKGAIQEWKAALGTSRSPPHIEIVHGNALFVSKTHGESVVGFDRIYVGASVERHQLHKLTFMLRPGGILVGPVDDELVKIVRIGSSSARTSMSTDNEMREDDGPGSSADFTQQVLSGVRFAPLLGRPTLPVVLPSRVWNPSVHRFYPDSFRRSCKELLLCSNASFQQPVPPTAPTVNVASLLPRVVWMEILSYTHRDWFEPPQSTEEFLRRRLMEEQASAQRAHQARQEMETRCHLLERERDVYRLLARRWQSRLEAALQQRGHVTGNSLEEDDDDDDEVEDRLILTGREQAVVFGLGAMLRSFHPDDDSEDDDDEDGDEEGRDHNRHLQQQPRVGNSAGGRGRQPMEEDADDSTATAAMMVVVAPEEEHSQHRATGTSQHTLPQLAMEEDDVTIGSSSSSALRPQIRTVSITSDDL